MFYKKPILLLVFGLFSSKLIAQVGNDNPKIKLTLSGYTEAYFVTDFNQTQKGERQVELILRTFLDLGNRNKYLIFVGLFFLLVWLQLAVGIF